MAGTPFDPGASPERVRRRRVAGRFRHWCGVPLFLWCEWCQTTCPDGLRTWAGLPRGPCPCSLGLPCAMSSTDGEYRPATRPRPPSGAHQASHVIQTYADVRCRSRHATGEKPRGRRFMGFRGHDRSGSRRDCSPQVSHSPSCPATTLRVQDRSPADARCDGGAIRRPSRPWHLPPPRTRIACRLGRTA